MEEEDLEDLFSGASAEPQRLPRPPLVGRQTRAAATEDDVAACDAATLGVPGTQRIWVRTFGCSHNTSDSEYMAGQLAAYGYKLVDDAALADLWLVNTCTVKSPSQSAMDTIIARGKLERKRLLVAGCVPQGDRAAIALQGLSVIGTAQIDRVVEAVELTLAGNTVHMLEKKALPRLDLPKIRKNPHVEIVPLSTGCLGACTYCKTKHARGHLGSYSPEALVERVRSAVADGVTEIWLSSEDTGAYGRDLDTDLSALLSAILSVLPADGRTMLRLGMTNPPFILEQLDAIADALSHPAVYACIHLPVQSGSDAVLKGMNREYTIAEFRRCADALLQRVPGLHIHTDVICGFPGETDAQFAETLALCAHYRFPAVHISQFYPRPGTPAARMQRVRSQDVKARSRLLSALHEEFEPLKGMEGRDVAAWFVEVAADGVKLVGHTKSYVQVLVEPQEGLLGCSALVRIHTVSRWSAQGEVLRILTKPRKETFAPAAPAPAPGAARVAASERAARRGAAGGDSTRMDAVAKPEQLGAECCGADANGGSCCSADGGCAAPPETAPVEQQASRQPAAGSPAAAAKFVVREAQTTAETQAQAQEAGEIGEVTSSGAYTRQRRAIAALLVCGVAVGFAGSLFSAWRLLLGELATGSSSSGSSSGDGGKRAVVAAAERL